MIFYTKKIHKMDIKNYFNKYFEMSTILIIFFSLIILDFNSLSFAWC